MDNVEACWTIKYGNPSSPITDLNGGVIVLESGRVFGAVSGYAYLGTYQIANGICSGSLSVIMHDPQVVSMYGAQEPKSELSFQVERIDAQSMRGAIHRAGYPSATLRLNRLAELP